MPMISNPIVMAFAVGIVPCPGVVLVMLFCLSMKMIGLGMVLSFWIALGMAITITGVVVLGLKGKRIIAQFGSRREKVAWLIEHIVETFAAFLITILGFLFFMANF
jgi:ABC-type nickel/cobalt efflux system permease component RcnA